MAGRREGVERTRQQVVAAVRTRLIADGYAGLSLEQVAEDAGVTRMTIYRRFGSKVGLLAAAADDLALRAEIVPRVAASLALPEPAQALRSLVTELCRFWATDPELFRRLIALAELEPPATGVLGDREAWRHRQVAAAVRRLTDHDRVRPPYGPRQAAATIAALTGFPCCDELATATRRNHADLPDLLMPMIGAVVHLGASGQ